MRNSVAVGTGRTLLLAALWLLLGILPLMAGGAVPGAASTETYSLAENSAGPLGKRAGYLQEGRDRLDLDRVLGALQAGKFIGIDRAVPGFGLGERPIWYHLAIDNPAAQTEQRYLTIGKTWLDRLDIYLVRDGALQRQWLVGDDVEHPFPVLPGVGFAVPLDLQPGGGDLLLRVETPEPMVLSVSLLSGEQLRDKERQAYYRHGLLYGFLLAFICYNTVLYFGLRDRSNLYYALYLFSFILLSLTYTGHAQQWLWPQQLDIQRYSIMSMMVLFGSAGFLFAGRFLRLELHAPRARQWVTWGSLGAIGLAVVSILAGNHLALVFIAFNFLAVFTVGMVWLGWLTISHGERAGYYFLSAAVCSMLGVALSLFAVWGFLPVNRLTFHGVEFGLALEATLLSLALASRFRQQEQARRAAEQLSRIDILTGVPNRRAFSHDAAGLWSTAVRYGRPLSAIMLDIDHFKHINDRYGHQAGDRILIEVAQLLADSCREGDLVARWGGEEFVLLLPETGLDKAHAFCERIRQAVERYPFSWGEDRIGVSASFGVAQLEQQLTLDELICEADCWLYRAKRDGRNRVAYTAASIA